MNRYPVDLSFFSHTTLKTGRCQCLGVIPTVNNDTISIDMIASVRLSQLERPLTVDPRMDIYACYISHRNVDSNTWITMMEEGVDGGTNYGTVACATTYKYEYLGGFQADGTQAIPKWLVAGPPKFWNEFGRIPNVTSSKLNEAALYTDVDDIKYGYKMARLPALSSTFAAQSTDAADQYVDVDVGNTRFNLQDLATVSARLKTEADRNWFTQRYRDLIQRGFGSPGVTVDVDQRPELLYSSDSPNYISGYDIDGTTPDTMGSATGKAQGMISMRIPPKRFSEGGAIWIFGVLRFPFIGDDEQHYLWWNTNDYETLMGDPVVFENQPPMAYTDTDCFGKNRAAPNTIGYGPYGQWYRWQPNRVSGAFKFAGWPFVDVSSITDVDTASYEQDEFNDYFSDETYGHAQIHALVKVRAQRVIPGASSSLYAGVIN